MRIATWNVNSVRARLPNVLAWLETAQPDVLLLQELKCQTEQFPALEFQAQGYAHRTVVGQKAYNGVALLSKTPLSDVVERLPFDPTDEQSRYVEAVVQGVRVVGLYAPNGNPLGTEKYPYKLAWMDRLRRHAQDLLATGVPFLMGGDWNVLSEEIDVTDPKGWEKDALFTLETRLSYWALRHLGLTEAFRALHPAEQAFTFWDYQGQSWERNHGLRIDDFLLSPQLADRLVSCTIDKAPRGLDKASDHVPVIVEISTP